MRRGGGGGEWLKSMVVQQYGHLLEILGGVDLQVGSTWCHFQCN